MGILDSILGTKSEAEFKSLPTKTDEQTKAINELVQALSGEVKDFDTSPELSSRQEELQSLLDSFTGTIGSAGGALDSALNFDQSAVDQLFQQSVADPLTKQFEQEILPLISRRFAPNFFGSDRALADQRATDDLMSTLVAKKAEFTNQERQRQLQALGLVPGVAGATTSIAKEGDLAKTNADEAFQKRLQLISALLGATGQNTFENVGVAKPGQEGALSAFLGGIGSGIGKKIG